MKSLLVLFLLCALIMPALAVDDSTEVDRVENSGHVLKEILNIPDNIPQDLLDKAECIIVLPSVKKAAFGVGVGPVARGAERLHPPAVGFDQGDVDPVERGAAHQTDRRQHHRQKTPAAPYP